MQRANDWLLRPSKIDFEVLSSMISELVRHHEQQLTGNEQSLDWQSPGARTSVIKFGTSGNLSNVVNQVPDAIAAEYQLSHQGVPVFAWHEYRWPYLHDTPHTQTSQSVYLPQECIDDLMQYHIDADTNWLSRYRTMLNRERAAQIDEIRVVTQYNSVDVF